MSAGYHRIGSGASAWSKPVRDTGYHASRPPLTIKLPKPIPHISFSDTPPPKVEVTLIAGEHRGSEFGRTQAIQSGYTGDECQTCSSMRMKISGHCLVCENCGNTTGCS